MRPKLWAFDDTVTTRGSARREQRRQQQAGEGEVAEVVGAELALEAVLGGGLRHRHDPGVVHEDVERLELVGEAARRTRAPRPATGGRALRTSGVGPGGLRLHRLERRRRLGRVAARQQHPGALGGQRLGRAQAQPAVGAGDHDRAARLVRDVRSGPLPHRPILAPAVVVDCIRGATSVPHLRHGAGLGGCPGARRLLPAAARVGAARRPPGLGAPAPPIRATCCPSGLSFQEEADHVPPVWPSDAGGPADAGPPRHRGR